MFISGAGTNPLLPIRRYEMTEVGEREWTIREWFLDGFAPYDEFCRFVAGQYSEIPMFFGLPAAEVVEQECQCRGDAACLFRIRWEEADGAAMRADYFEVHNKVLEARLEQLQAMVTDLASNERYEDVLQGIVASSVRAVGAAGVVLALKPRAGSAGKVYAEGLSEAEGGSIAEDLLDGTDREGSDCRPGRVGSSSLRCARRRRARRGLHLTDAGDSRDLRAQLAAATLDAADAMEDARHQANTAGALLDLSTSLAEIMSTKDMAARVAGAVPQVIDCDRVALFLDDGDWTGADGGELQLAAAHGYPDEALALLSVRPITEAQLRTIREDGIEYTLLSDVGTRSRGGRRRSAWRATRSAALWPGSPTTPSASPSRPALSDRLKGLAAQASIAIGNARLVEQIRFQSVHDALTGLPNRALILDRTEQMLARSRRSHIPVAALFIDLDGFKEVNDTLGHGFGDQLLQAVATRLSLTIRESDSIGRMGGDEFVVLVDGTTTDAGPELVAERLLSVLREPFAIEGLPNGPLTLTASIGIAAGSRPSPTELLRDADIALYQAKAAGRDCFVVFRPQMHTAVQDRLLLEMDLRERLLTSNIFLSISPSSIWPAGKRVVSRPCCAGGTPTAVWCSLMNSFPFSRHPA